MDSFLTENKFVSIRKANQVMPFRHIIRIHCEKSYVTGKKGEVHLITGHEGPEGSVGIALLFL
jgi:hypothetical protein